MRAVVCHRFDGIDGLTVEEVPDPGLGSGEVRIRVRAAAVNFADLLMIRGRYQLRPERPFVPGFEAAGEVLEVGERVESIVPGDRVMAFTWTGALAEEMVVEESAVFPAPTATSHGESACLVTAYGTAHHALIDRGLVREGETVAVLGAAGGVGLAAVEIARHLGAVVIAAVSSDRKEAVVRDRGVREIIRYDREDLRTRLRESTAGAGPDVVFDPVGGEMTESCLREMAHRGRLLIVGFAAGDIPALPANLPLLRSASIVGVNWGMFAERRPSEARSAMAELTAWADQGLLRPVVTGSYPLPDFARAFAQVADRDAVGRVVLHMG